MTLARDARERGRWTEYGDLNFDSFSGAGGVAVGRSFRMYFVPALLQTEEYARTIINDVEPRMNADVSRQRVGTRTRCEQVCALKNWQRYRIVRE